MNEWPTALRQLAVGTFVKENRRPTMYRLETKKNSHSGIAPEAQFIGSYSEDLALTPVLFKSQIIQHPEHTTPHTLGFDTA